jgi:hypothetical protein
MPLIYNAFVKDLKSALASGELGGPRLDMWWRIRQSGLGLISTQESEDSDVTTEEAQEVNPSLLCHHDRRR